MAQPPAKRIPSALRPGHQQVGHVGGLVDEPPLVRRPARLEDLVVDVGAVDAGLVDRRGRSRRAPPGATSPSISNSVRASPGCASSDGSARPIGVADPLPLGQEAGPDAAAARSSRR